MSTRGKVSAADGAVFIVGVVSAVTVVLFVCSLVVSPFLA